MCPTFSSFAIRQRSPGRAYAQLLDDEAQLRFDAILHSAARAFVRSLTDLGNRLERLTVAEWVQDEHTAKMLQEWGCDYLQGR